MTDLDTAVLLEEFKTSYVEPITKLHRKYMGIGELSEKDTAKAKDIADKYHFLSLFCASIEGTLEQNLVLKMELKKHSI